ncbi:MAG: hypothetical protein OWU84_05225 [Firmicutes bacterium]|nr:hypothetical protein [Bacillota bacterium]
MLLTLDILAGNTPRYLLAERLTLTDVAMLVGQGCQDDDLDRVFDQRARAGPATVFSAWPLAASTQEGVVLTTGPYAGWSPNNQRMASKALRVPPMVLIEPPVWAGPP